MPELLLLKKFVPNLNILIILPNKLFFIHIVILIFSFLTPFLFSVKWHAEPLQHLPRLKITFDMYFIYLFILFLNSDLFFSRRTSLGILRQLKMNLM